MKEPNIADEVAQLFIDLNPTEQVRFFVYLAKSKQWRGRAVKSFVHQLSEDSGSVAALMLFSVAAQASVKRTLNDVTDSGSPLRLVHSRDDEID